MQFMKLPGDFSVCKIKTTESVDFSCEFVFFAKTDDELSVVCETGAAPSDAIAAEHGWRGFKICGVLDFGMVGVLAKISAALAENDISIFVVSTYNTDYIFVKGEHCEKAAAVLRGIGFSIKE